VAELAEEIDTGRAQVALEAAEDSVAGLGSSTGRSGATGEAEEPDIELVEAEAALLRAQVRLEAVDATSGTTA